jgi:hypothetical protein
VRPGIGRKGNERKLESSIVVPTDMLLCFLLWKKKGVVYGQVAQNSCRSKLYASQQSWKPDAVAAEFVTINYQFAIYSLRFKI